jgi:integrase
MAVRKRKGRYVDDYYERMPDGSLARRTKWFRTKRAAADHADRREQATPAGRPAVDPAITFADYGKLLLARHEGEPRTKEVLADTLRNHLLPTFGHFVLREIDRASAKTFLKAKKDEPICKRGKDGAVLRDAAGAPVILRTHRSPRSVRIMYSVLRWIGSEAVDDGILNANPFAKLGKRLKLEPLPKARAAAVKKKAMTEAQLRRFLTVAQQLTPTWYPLFLLLARTGLRIGEALGLLVTDFSPDFRRVRVERELSRIRTKAPKTESSVRTVKLSAQSATVIRQHVEVTRKADKLAHGWRELPPFVFYAATEPEPLTHDAYGFPVPTGTLDPHNVRRAMRRLLAALAAEDAMEKLAPADRFPRHFTPHGLRHTYASIRISKGDSIKDVQEQLGHEDFALTVNTYGSWLPSGDTISTDHLDDPAWSVDATHQNS